MSKGLWEILTDLPKPLFACPMLPIITTKPGKKYRSLKRPRVYEALRRQGMSKQSAARISNAQAHKAFTLDQLEAFVSSEHYDSATADLIARGIPALKSAGVDGELISPGVRRLHGNLCNVHGRYGPCDKALSGKKKPAKGVRKPAKGRAPVKPKQTPEQHAQARQQQRQANIDSVAKRMAATDTGLSPSGSKALAAFAQGQQPDKVIGDGLAKMGLAELASDGSYRMTPTGRAVVGAMAAGDYQRAVDGISRGTDAANARQGRQAEHAKRQQDSAGKRVSAAMGRELAKRERDAKRTAAQAKKKPAKASAGGSKKPARLAPERPRTARAKRPARSSARGASPSRGGSSAAPAKPKPVKQIAPALTEAAQSLSDGKELSDADTQALIRNGLARLVKGQLVLTAAGMRATKKDFSFRVFKDASGRYRWVAQSSTAFQDRDKEIVSTKALNDDCAYADKTGSYGPLRWWHTPGLDLGDCDFNAMHGRILIESGTFRSPSIAYKVAQAADDLEISLGFLHLPNEPDASGVFNHIRRFERSLVPRGKASNRFTAFSVKESPMANQFTPEKIAGMKAIGFTDDDIAGFSAQATQTEKAADGMLVASKADDPVLVNTTTQQGALADEITINGVTYKAMPPMLPGNAAEDAADGGADDMAETPIDDGTAEGGLTLSPEDLSAIGQAVGDAIQGAVAQIMGALDLEKKVGAHVQGMMAPYTATKDAADAERAEQITQLQTSLKAAQDQITPLQAKLDELLGLQPAVTPRVSSAAQSILNPFNPADSALLAAVKDQVPADQQQSVNEWDNFRKQLIGG